MVRIVLSPRIMFSECNKKGGKRCQIHVAAKRSFNGSVLCAAGNARKADWVVCSGWRLFDSRQIRIGNNVGDCLQLCDSSKHAVRAWAHRTAVSFLLEEPIQRWMHQRSPHSRCSKKGKLYAVLNGFELILFCFAKRLNLNVGRLSWRKPSRRRLCQFSYGLDCSQLFVDLQGDGCSSAVREDLDVPF